MAGKVCHEHVASLGSVPDPPSAYDRLDFWQALHERLARLSNRIDGDAFGKIMAAVHARIPMVTIDEKKELQLRSAEDDVRFTQSMHDMQEESVGGYKQLVSNAQTAIAGGEIEMVKLSEDAARAKTRLERLQRGADISGRINRPMTDKEFLAAIGWTAADVRHARVLRELEKLGATREAIETAIDSKQERAIYRKVLRDKRRALRG